MPTLGIAGHEVGVPVAWTVPPFTRSDYEYVDGIGMQERLINFPNAPTRKDLLACPAVNAYLANDIETWLRGVEYDRVIRIRRPVLVATMVCFSTRVMCLVTSSRTSAEAHCCGRIGKIAVSR